MRGFGWLVLLLLFVDELLCVVAAGVVGFALWGVAGAILGPVVVIALWWAFASPKARWGGHGLRPLVKIVLFAGCSIGLMLTGYLWWGIAFAMFSLIVNALAQMPSIRTLAERAGVSDEVGRAEHPRGWRTPWH